MVYTLIVHSAPHTGTGSRSALGFAHELLAQGHAVARVFFYHEGVHNALVTAVVPQGEDDLRERWQAFARDSACELAVCIAAALRRGVLNDEEAERYERPATTSAPFAIVGLGQLVDAMMTSDRCITFVD